MTHPGHLKVAVKVRDVRDEGRDLIVVLDCAFRWDYLITLWTGSAGTLLQDEREGGPNLADAYDTMICDKLSAGVTESRQIRIPSTDNGIISLAALVS